MAPDVVNPQMPVGFELAWAIVVAVYLVVVAVAVTSLWRSRDRLSPTSLVLWALAIVVLPLTGGVAWLLVGRQMTRRRVASA